MDSYRRHQRLFHSLALLLKPWIEGRFSLTHERIPADGPILLIPNHVTAWDPILIGICLEGRQVYFVASEHIFRLGAVTKLLNWAFAPIPRRKASSGIDTVKACLRHLKDGHSVCLFAEGEQSWDGRSIPVFPATGKLAKVSGATLVTYRLEGAYLSLPRWGKGIRKGAVHGRPVGIYTPEQLKRMTPKEIEDAINRDIYEDIWERQRRKPVRYRGKRRAEGMERALYACPTCRGIGTLRTKDNRIICSCGFERVFSETGFFEPAEPFKDLAEWDAWQKELLKREDFRHEGEVLFFDEKIELTRIRADHTEEKLTGGTLCQYEDRLVCGDQSFPMAEITDMAMVRNHLLLLSCGGAYYEMRTRQNANLRKYLDFRNR